MFSFGTPGGSKFDMDYVGSVACFGSDGEMIAISKINPLQLEQENFQPLTVAELMTMVGTGNIDPKRLEEWGGAPIIWNTWTILIDHPSPVVLANLIAASFSQLLALERFAMGDPEAEDVLDYDETEPLIVAPDEDDDDDEDEDPYDLFSSDES